MMFCDTMSDLRNGVCRERQMLGNNQLLDNTCANNSENIGPLKLFMSLQRYHTVQVHWLTEDTQQVLIFSGRKNTP